MSASLVLRRYGGDRQAVLLSLSDLRAAIELPDAAWAVTACPLRDLTLDESFARLLDVDQDGTIRCDDVRSVVQWLMGSLTLPLWMRRQLICCPLPR